MNADMVKPEKFGHLHLVYHSAVPLRLKEVCDNLPSSFDISDIPMVVYILNPLIRSTLLTISNLCFI